MCEEMMSNSGDGDSAENRPCLGETVIVQGCHVTELEMDLTASSGCTVGKPNSGGRGLHTTFRGPHLVSSLWLVVCVFAGAPPQRRTARPRAVIFHPATRCRFR